LLKAPAARSPELYFYLQLETILAVSTKPIAFVAASIAVVVGLWLLFKPQRVEVEAPDTATAARGNASLAMGSTSNTSEQPVPGMPARSDVFELIIKGGKPVGGPKVLQVHEGEQVTLNIQSDSADELHLHGYDLHAHITPDRTATLQFTAYHTGRFGMELHKAHTELGALEVYPR
jgi:hypothetical protein